MTTLAERSAFPSTPGLYVLHFPNGKKYVGVTRNSLRTRLLHHCNAALAGRTKQAVRAAIAKYGLDSVLVSFPQNDGPLLEAEKALVAAMVADGHHLYNQTDGGEGVCGFSHSPNTRKAMSSSARQSWTDERRNAASRLLRSPEVRTRMVENQKRSWTSERRARMAQMVRARSAKLDESKVGQVVKLLADGQSCASIARQYGVTPEAISAIKHGKNWSHVSGIARA